MLSLTKLQKIGISAVVLLGTTAIAFYLKKQLNKLIKGKFTVQGIKDIYSDLKKINFTLLCTLENAGDFSATVSEQDLAVSVNGMFVSNIKGKTNFKIKSKGVSSIPLVINLYFSDMLRAGVVNIFSILNDKSKVKINIKGTINIKAGIVTLDKYPLDLNFNLSDILGAKKPINNQA